MDKLLLVTGGSRGIGAATCRRAAASGYSVAVNYRSDADAANALVAELKSTGADAEAFMADVSCEEEVIELFSSVVDRLGVPTAVVNSAGIAGKHMDVVEFDATVLQELMQINVVGTMLCCREAARHMSTARGGDGGSIVNVSSMAATIGGRPGHCAYAASKAAVDAFTVGFAKEVGAQGIRVNTVRPGVTLTDMTSEVKANATVRSAVEATIAMNRVACADEIAAPVMWLLSSEASFVSGAHLDASGGGFVIGASTASVD
ncbi:hypothetical protein AB833_01830 [Chromatiales bacterium (ex Bugula neritina AB1)]|nr:hypothetical protein AB833_01830 [Chromatiales bacterium (ex Bugula neritina AB1)]